MNIFIINCSLRTRHLPHNCRWQLMRGERWLLLLRQVMFGHLLHALALESSFIVEKVVARCFSDYGGVAADIWFEQFAISHCLWSTTLFLLFFGLVYLVEGLRSFFDTVRWWILNAGYLIFGKLLDVRLNSCLVFCQAGRSARTYHSIVSFELLGDRRKNFISFLLLFAFINWSKVIFFDQWRGRQVIPDSDIIEELDEVEIVVDYLVQWLISILISCFFLLLFWRPRVLPRSKALFVPLIHYIRKPSTILSTRSAAIQWALLEVLIGRWTAVMQIFDLNPGHLNCRSDIGSYYIIACGRACGVGGRTVQMSWPHFVFAMKTCFLHVS